MCGPYQKKLGISPQTEIEDKEEEAIALESVIEEPTELPQISMVGEPVYCYFGDGSFNYKSLGRSRRYHLPKEEDPGISRCGATLIDFKSKKTVDQVMEMFEGLLCKRCFKEIRQPTQNKHLENFTDDERTLSPSIQSVDLPSNAVQVGLILEVSGNQKGKVRKEIEDRVLRPHRMVKLKPRGNEYELRCTHKSDLDCKEAVQSILNEMENPILIHEELIDGTTFGDLRLLKRGLHYSMPSIKIRASAFVKSARIVQSKWASIAS